METTEPGPPVHAILDAKAGGHPILSPKLTRSLLRRAVFIAALQSRFHRHAPATFPVTGWRAKQQIVASLLCMACKPSKVSSVPAGSTPSSHC